MKQRGRRSAADLSVVVDLSRRPPPEPPGDLSDEQATVWRDAVGGLPSGWLVRGAYPILTAYCRHTVRARLLEAQIARFRMEWLTADGGVERLNRLLAMAERETRAMTACARALRITPQSQIYLRTAGRAIDNMPSGPRPWD